MTLKNFEKLLIFRKGVGVELVFIFRKGTPFLLFLRDFGKISRGCFVDRAIHGTKYSRIGQVKFLEESL